MLASPRPLVPTFSNLPRRLVLIAFAAWAPALFAQPETIVDLATIEDGDDRVLRVHGASGDGRYGVPVAGGHDVDCDGFEDAAVAFMTAPRGAIAEAGEVALVFGDGRIDGTLDVGTPNPRILRILGTARQEHTGSEIWMDDVTGDGFGDLLICRQDYTLGTRCGAGALTIVAGGQGVRDLADNLQTLDLGAPPMGVTVTTIVGQAAGDRLCIWTRTGDVDGDGTADIVVAADQEDAPGESNRGAVYVLKGGAHLASGTTYDLAGWGSARRAVPLTPAKTGTRDAPLAKPEPIGRGAGHPLDGLLAKIVPDTGATRHHLGATCQVADLDGDGRSEVLFAAALNRAGAALRPDTSGTCSGSVVTESNGGTSDGTLYIAWADNFPASPAPWPAGFTLTLGDPPGTWTTIHGEARNIKFGEEIVSDVDLDGDGTDDLVVGDLVADGTAAQNRPTSGLGHVLFHAPSLAGRTFTMESPPGDVVVTRILGPSIGAIGDDTAAIGDFDGDGRDDVALSAPHADPQGRDSAGVMHVLYGRDGAWPALVDLAPGAIPSPAVLRVAEIQGALGTSASFASGDTLAYSASSGDLDGDGRTDLVINEMEGDGLGGPLDVGNLIVVSGRALDPTLVFDDDFESGDVSRWSTAQP